MCTSESLDLVYIRARSVLRTFCPSRATSLVKNGTQKGNGLDDQDAVSQYNTLLSSTPARWGGKLSSLIRPIVVPVFFFVVFFWQCSLASQDNITRCYFLLEYNFKYINESCAFSTI